MEINQRRTLKSYLNLKKIKKYSLIVLIVLILLTTLIFFTFDYIRETRFYEKFQHLSKNNVSVFDMRLSITSYGIFLMSKEEKFLNDRKGYIYDYIENLKEKYKYEIKLDDNIEISTKEDIETIKKDFKNKFKNKFISTYYEYIKKRYTIVFYNNSERLVYTVEKYNDEIIVYTQDNKPLEISIREDKEYKELNEKIEKDKQERDFNQIINRYWLGISEGYVNNYMNITKKQMDKNIFELNIKFKKLNFDNKEDYEIIKKYIGLITKHTHREYIKLYIDHIINSNFKIGRDIYNNMDIHFNELFTLYDNLKYEHDEDNIKMINNFNINIFIEDILIYNYNPQKNKKEYNVNSIINQYSDEYKDIMQETQQKEKLSLKELDNLL